MHISTNVGQHSVLLHIHSLTDYLLFSAAALTNTDDLRRPWGPGTADWGCLAGRCASLCLQAAHGGRAAGGSG